MGSITFPAPTSAIVADPFYYRQLFSGNRLSVYLSQSEAKPALPKLRLRQVASDTDFVLTQAALQPTNTELAAEGSQLYGWLLQDSCAIAAFYLSHFAISLRPSAEPDLAKPLFRKRCASALRADVLAQLKVRGSTSAKALVELTERALAAMAKSWESAYQAGDSEPWKIFSR